MSRERADYRANLQDILSFTGGARLLSVKQVCQYLGIRDRRTAKAKFPFKDNRISAATLASRLSEGEIEERRL